MGTLADQRVGFKIAVDAQDSLEFPLCLCQGRVCADEEVLRRALPSLASAGHHKEVRMEPQPDQEPFHAVFRALQRPKWTNMDPK